MVVESAGDWVGHRSMGGDVRYLLVFCLSVVQGVCECRGVFWVFAGDMYWVGGCGRGHWVAGELALCEEDLRGNQDGLEVPWREWGLQRSYDILGVFLLGIFMGMDGVANGCMYEKDTNTGSLWVWMRWIDRLMRRIPAIT